MSLNITTEPQEDRQLKVVVEVAQERVDQQLRKAARKLAREYRIPGFRKGKAPYNIIVQYLGEHTLYNEIIDDLGQEVYKEVLEEAEFEPYAQAALSDVGFDPLTYTLTVPLEPIVDLGDYRTVRVQEEPVEVDEAQVTAQLESYREQYAGWQDVTRPSAFGDMLNINVLSVIPASEDDDEEITVLDETDWDVTPDQENPMEPPGFDEALIDIEPGETKEFDLSWPDDSQSIYAGKTAHFTVTLNNIQAYELPALDDELAQLVGPDFETLDDLLKNIRESLQEQAEREADNNYLEKVFDAVLAQAALEYPPVVVEDQIDSMVNEFEQRLRQYGIGDIESYFEQVGQSLEQYRETLREQAEITARRNLIISELWKVEKIKATEEDVDKKVSEMFGSQEADEESAFAELVGDETDLDIADRDAEALDIEADVEIEAAANEEAGDEEPDGDEPEQEELLAELHDAEALDAEPETGDELETDDPETPETDGNPDNSRTIADMFRNGPARQILEAQIVQEKTIERLLAIVRGEEVPDLSTLEDDESEGEEEQAAEAGEEALAPVAEPVADEHETDVAAETAQESRAFSVTSTRRSQSL